MNGMLGEVKIFAGNFRPVGWTFCDGQLINIDQNTALYSVLGTIYGGDGRTTFALPDLRNKTLEGNEVKGLAMQYIICIKGEFPVKA